MDSSAEHHGAAEQPRHRRDRGKKPAADADRVEQHLSGAAVLLLAQPEEVSAPAADGDGGEVPPTAQKKVESGAERCPEDRFPPSVAGRSE